MSLPGNSLAVQWLGFHAFTFKGIDLIPDGEIRILQALWHHQNIFLLKNKNQLIVSTRS